jgi:hypothetical protein
LQPSRQLPRETARETTAMEDYATSFLNAIEESATPEVEDREDEGPNEADTDAKKRRGLRSGIFRAANIQDKLLEK